MFSKNKKIELLLNEVETNFFKNNKFKTNSLKELNERFPVKKINDFQFTYGYDEGGLDYYFILINKEREGFIFSRYQFKEAGVYTHRDFIRATKSFEGIEAIFENILSSSILRESYISRMYRDNPSEIEFSFQEVLSNIVFNHSLQRPQKAKIMGLLALSIFQENINAYEDENTFFFDRGVEKLNRLKVLTQEVESDYHDNIVEYSALIDSDDVNTLISKIIICDIEDLLKKEINLSTIYDFLSYNNSVSIQA